MRLLLLIVVVGVGLAGGAWWLVPRLVDPVHVADVRAAVLICVSAGVLAMAPVAIVARRSLEYLLFAALAAILIRLFLTLAVGAYYWANVATAKSAFRMAALVTYLALLAGETGLILYLSRRHTPADQPREDAA